MTQEIDALDPQPSYIGINGTQYAVSAPSLSVFIRLQREFARMQSVDDLTDEQLDEVEAKIMAGIKKCIPSLNFDLNAAQIMEIGVKILSLGTPQLGEELKKRGIEVDSSKKAS